jgi:Resolvase, N terminal domain
MTTGCVVYCRVSSKDQEREGFSIPAQQKLLREYARAQRLVVLREFIDVETARQAGRGGFGQMLQFLKSDPTCSTILVEKTDRLYRNIKDWTTVDDLDVTIHFVKENAIVSKAEPDLYGRVPLARQNASRLAHAAHFARDVRAGAGSPAAQASRPQPEAPSPLHGPAHLRPLWLHLTAELKKARYVYYRCTGSKGRCGNSYMRQEELSELLGVTIDAIQIPAAAADFLADALRMSQELADTERRETRERLGKQHRALVSKIDRAYDDYLEGRIPKDFWTRKSEQWEEERRSLEVQRARLDRPEAQLTVTGQRILELA